MFIPECQLGHVDFLSVIVSVENKVRRLLEGEEDTAQDKSQFTSVYTIEFVATPDEHTRLMDFARSIGIEIKSEG